MSKYAPWKGFLLWLGNLPILAYLIIYQGMNRDLAAAIHGICFIITLFWAMNQYDQEDLPDV